MSYDVYAVREGRETGVFTNWDRTNDAVNGYPGAEYKGFNNRQRAKSWLNGGNVPTEEEQENEPGDNVLPPAENGVAVLHVLHKSTETVWYARADGEIITIDVDDSIIHTTDAAVRFYCLKLRLMGYRTRVERRVEGWRKIPDNWGLVRGGNTTKDDRIWDKEEQMWLPISESRAGERVDSFCGVLRRNLTEEEKRHFGSSTRSSRPGSVHQGIGRIEDQEERRYEEHV